MAPWDGWQWAQLLPENAPSFKWAAGETPFSDVWMLPATWGVYFTVVYLLGAWMDSRDKFSIRYVTALHNLVLLVWSAAMFFYLLWAASSHCAQYGWRSLFCAATPQETQGPMQWSLYIFYVSKFYELLDTVVIRLKKRPLIFLHYYHHAIVIAMTWSWLHYTINFACLGMLANTLVHIFMYYYYFCSSLGYSVWYKKYITRMQLVQFAASFVFSIVFKYLALTGPCIGGQTGPFEFTLACNLSFFYLFSQFYAKTYKQKPGAAEKKLR